MNGRSEALVCVNIPTSLNHCSSANFSLREFVSVTHGVNGWDVSITTSDHCDTYFDLSYNRYARTLFSHVCVPRCELAAIQFSNHVGREVK